MNVLSDMNLSPDWVEVLGRHGWTAIHWSTVGDPRAGDAEIMGWARAHDCIIVTHDLDFGTLLALTYVDGPSVIQIRTQSILPPDMEERLVGVLSRFGPELNEGALIVVDESRLRVRLLPLLRQ